ncbi:uncharacterized protein LOC126326527 [Schistocerca gregaria]|uniref:uncharacterized protein LOC126326527 n=1 Tax=Schistocerca gregaria TaxID=7010 RepID=UPI00211EA902|nr:uncharacterized protein LOC126326527 [Schistocerca gregaria]
MNDDASTDDVQTWDLTPKIIPFLDRHHVLLLLSFLEENRIYDEGDIKLAKYNLLKSSNMIDLLIEIHASIYGDDNIPQEMKEKREKVLQQNEVLQNAAIPLLKLIQDINMVKSLHENKQYTMSYLEEYYSITSAHLSALYDLAKFKYECGDYATAADYLMHFRELSSDPELHLHALWGRLAVYILLQYWDDALVTVNLIRDTIDHTTNTSPLVQLQQRTWLIHWSLFVYFSNLSVCSQCIELFSNDRYYGTIQTTCPYIRRYLAVALIITKKRKTIKDIQKIVEHGWNTYSDPITQFTEALFVQFDFELADQILVQCEKVFEQDYFLYPFKEEFMQSARLSALEIYFKVHNCFVTKKLGMDFETSEEWIASLIRNFKLNAKIDSQAGQVFIGPRPSVYQQLIDRTREWAMRFLMFSGSFDRGKNLKNRERGRETSAKDPVIT